LAVYAALRGSDGALTVMVITKSANPLSANLALNRFTGVSARAYYYSSKHTNQVVTLPNQSVGASGFQAVYPASSITLFVIPSAHPHIVYLPALLLRP
jgi:hypothetical protein